jgi:primosomal protein N'
MIADVVFDLPVNRAFSYAVPEHLTVAPGQRVLAPLGGATRPGLVVALRASDERRLKPLAAALEPEPVMSRSQIELARWIAAQSGSSLGSTCMALLPPVREDEPTVTPPPWPGGRAPIPELLVGADRADRLLHRLAAHEGGILLLTADVASAEGWARRLSGLGAVARLDSGVGDHERRRTWTALAAGRTRVAVGARSALLAPVPVPTILALIDEHEPAHKPPGPPRIHARDVVLERSAVEGSQLLLTSATPSVEMWWRADRGQVRLSPADPGPWPIVTVADTRGQLRAEPLTPALARAAHDALTRGHRVYLLVSRLTSALACDDCGAIFRCPDCGIALAFSRADATLLCRQCARGEPAPDTCPACAGRRLSIFGWGAERVEHAVRRRYPRARIARYDPDAKRGARLERQRADATRADIVIGTRGALRLFEPGSLGAAGAVAPDQLLRLPDFRASERLFALLWAMAERVRPDGQLVIQSQHPDHYCLRAVASQDLAEFYKHELRFRGELGYPPFRRLCRVTARAGSERTTRELIRACHERLERAGVTVYPPSPDRRGLVWTVVGKGHDDLAARATAALDELPRGRRPPGDVVEIDLDPVD